MGKLYIFTKLLHILILLVFLGQNVYAQERILSVPANTVVNPGSTFTIIVHIDNASGVTGYLISFQFDPAFITFVSAGNSSLTNGWSNPIPNANAGVINIANFGSNPLSGEGNLLEIQFQMGLSGGASDLIFQKIELNDGDIPATGNSGKVSSSQSPSPTSMPTPINTPTKTFTPIVTPSLTSRILSVPTNSLVNSGSNFSIPVHIDNAAGVTGYLISLKFDTSVITYVSVNNSTLTRVWNNPITNINAGILNISSFSSNPISGEGDLVEIQFQMGLSGGSSDLIFQKIELNDGDIPATGKSGKVSSKKSDSTPTWTPTYTPTNTPTYTPTNTFSPTKTYTPTYSPTSFYATATPWPKIIYYSENFDTINTSGLVRAGWRIGKNAYAKEEGTDFFVAPEWLIKAPSTGTGFLNPPTMDGTESSGGYLMSDSDSAGGSDDIFSQSEFWAITPVFSTIGSTEIWFHADIDLISNNNGEGVAEFAVTVDDGKTWLPFFQMVEPQRVQKGIPNGAGALRTNGYPILGSGSQTKTFDGIHGRKHFKLPAIANNQSIVRIRFEWYEPADAWWMAIDNILVDNSPPPVGKEVIFFENFDNGIPVAWKNTTEKNEKWGTTPLKAGDGSWLKLTNAWGPTNIDILQMAKEFGMTIDLNNPDPQLNPNGSVLDGRWILMLAGQKYVMYQESGDEDESANLDTPSLNLSDSKYVYLDFDSEMLRGNNVSVFYDVYVSVDGGKNFNIIFNYEGALTDDGGESPYFDHQYLLVPSAAGKSNVIFRFAAKGGDPGSDSLNPRMYGFWVIDNVRVTADKFTNILTPTSIPTNTPTNTFTKIPTPTLTVKNTPVITSTFTPTRTYTPTLSPTNTITPTVTPTDTRPAISTKPSRVYLQFKDNQKILLVSWTWDYEKNPDEWEVHIYLNGQYLDRISISGTERNTSYPFNNNGKYMVYVTARIGDWLYDKQQWGISNEVTWPIPVTPTFTPTPTPSSLLLLSSYELEKSTLLENGWMDIPGGFTGMQPGNISTTTFSNSIFTTSKDQKGLKIEVNNKQVSFIYAASDVSGSGKPILLKLYVRSSNEKAQISLALLKGNIQSGNVDGSIATHTTANSKNFVLQENAIALMYQPDEEKWFFAVWSG